LTTVLPAQQHFVALRLQESSVMGKQKPQHDDYYS